LVLNNQSIKILKCNNKICHWARLWCLTSLSTIFQLYCSRNRSNQRKPQTCCKSLDQWKPILVWIITRVSSFKIVSGDAVHQPTWPLLLKIEHMVKLQVLGNNSKTVNNIKNLTWGKNYQHIKIYITLQFWSKSDYPSWSYCPFFIKFVKF
jgi:hypothetical protein